MRGGYHYHHYSSKAQNLTNQEVKHLFQSKFLLDWTVKSYMRQVEGENRSGIKNITGACTSPPARHHCRSAKEFNI